MPPVQVIRSPALYSLTLTGNARPGFAWECTLIVSPGAIVPSTRSTPESHAAYGCASVRLAQNASPLASMEAVGSQELIVSIRNNSPAAPRIAFDFHRGDPFDLLGDPTRRAIVELLAGGDRSVREL